MSNKKFLFLIFAGIFLIAGIFASYTLGNPKNSIQGAYSKGENIKGWINLTLTNEPAISILSDSFGNSISLINLLKTAVNSGVNYVCNPTNCQSFYTKSNSEVSKTIPLIAGQEKLIGFVLNDNLESITDFSLTIASDAVKSKDNQLKIDLFNDGTKDIGNTKAETQSGEWSAVRDYSCFNDAEPQKQWGSVKSGDSYCQRVAFPEAPGFSLGAWLKKNSPSDSLNLKMYLYDLDLEEVVKDCVISPGEITEQETPVYCDVEYLVTKQKDYYVCLSAESGPGIYRMQGYGYIDRCGFRGSPSSGNEETAAYKIFTQPRFFDAIGTLEIPDTLPSGDSISVLISDYIYDNYDEDLKCAGKNCIIPIKLISNVQQTLTISGQIVYDDPNLGSTEQKNIYDLSENSAKINADRQKIFLDGANFTVPHDIGEHTLKLFLDNVEILTKQIEVKKGIEIFSIAPVKTAAGLPTNFKVRFNANNISIAKYKWDFNNDGIIDETTLTNIAEHTYNLTGTYELIINIEDTAGVSSSEKFNIEVGFAKDVLDGLITQKQEELADIKGEMSNYELFSGSAIKNVLDLDAIEEKLAEIQSNYTLIKDSGTEQNFQVLLSRLLEIELPSSISKTLDSAPLTFFPQKENIDLSVIETIAGGSYDAELEEEYKDALLTWDLNNVQAKVSVKEYSANYGFGDEMLVKTFVIDMKDLEAKENFYVFVKETEGMGFKENMSYDDSGYYYKESPDKSFEFYTTEDISVEELPVFISPSLEELSVDSGAGATPKKAGKKFKWELFIIIIFVVILIGFAVYFLLKKWYKEKYENYLFKDKNDLYNMVTYLHGAKQQGKKDNEIAKDLRKSGWNNEQINYVIKKYSGKNVGMPGFAERSHHKIKLH